MAGIHGSMCSHPHLTILLNNRTFRMTARGRDNSAHGYFETLSRRSRDTPLHWPVWPPRPTGFEAWLRWSNIGSTYLDWQPGPFLSIDGVASPDRHHAERL